MSKFNSKSAFESGYEDALKGKTKNYSSLKSDFLVFKIYVFYDYDEGYAKGLEDKENHFYDSS